VKSNTRTRIQNHKHFISPSVDANGNVTRMIVAFGSTINYLLCIRTTLTGMPRFPPGQAIKPKRLTEDKVPLSTPIFSPCECFPVAGRLKGIRSHVPPKEKARLEEPSRRDILLSILEGSICFKWSAPCALKNKRQVVGGARALVMCEMHGQPEPLALRSGDGFWMRRDWRKCEARERKMGLSVW
jgi:hypothetical protein